MNNLIDKELMKMFEQMYNHILTDMGMYVADAQALCAIFMLIYFAIKLYPVIAGERKLEIVPLLRPFAIAMVLMLWGPTVSAIKFPMDVISGKAKAKFYTEFDEVDRLSRKRYKLIDDVAKELIETSLEVERAEKESDKKPFFDFGIDIEPIMKKIAGMWLLVQSKIKFMLVQLMERIVIIFFQMCVYFIFFIQIIFSSILVILGPLSFAISVLPAFRDTWVNWVSRFISVSLYSAIAYIVLTTVTKVLQFGLEREISSLQTIMNNDYAFIMYVSHMSGDMTLYTVCALLGGVSLLTVPVISTWIVQTSGINQAVTAMGAGAAAATRTVV